MKKKILLILGVLIILYFILYFINYSYIVDNDVEIIKIELKDTTLNYINKHSKENKYYNNKIKIYNHGKKELSSTVMIKGRGNYTWNLKKKPYQIAFDEKQSILGFPETKKYILLANDSDPSLLKNDFSYSLAKRMGLNYSFTGKYIDLYVDDKYIGNYYVTPKIGLNKATVNIKNDNAIIMELDNTYYKAEKEDEVFETKFLSDHLVLKDSNSKNPLDDMKVFEDKYNEMEQAIINKDYNKLNEIIDIDSFAKYYIISEFSENFDSIHSSLFFYMDGYDDKIHIGPIWDCDLAYGHRPEYSNTSSLPIKNHEFPEDEGYSVLFYKLLQIDEFNNRVKEVWNNEGRDTYLKEIELLDKKITKLNLSGSYNNEHWKKIKFNTATKVFKEWVERRYKFFNDYMEE